MYLKIGSSGNMVKLLQQALCRVGYGVACDGWYGSVTKEAVKRYQREHGLTADGIAGPVTLARLGIGAATTVQKPSPTLPRTSLVLKKSKRRIKYIVVHCTATKEGQDVTVDELRKLHKDKGWSDIGYHYVIYRDGTIVPGRDVDIAGAHVAGFNSNSIGVVYVGGLENNPHVPYTMLKAKDTRTEEQKASLLSLLMDLKQLYPDAFICGHRDMSPDKNHNGIVEPQEWVKQCPSFDAKAEYRRV